MSLNDVAQTAVTHCKIFYLVVRIVDTTLSRKKNIVCALQSCNELTRWLIKGKYKVQTHTSSSHRSGL